MQFAVLRAQNCGENKKVTEKKNMSTEILHFNLSS